MRKISMLGKTFGRLVVLKQVEPYISPRGQRHAAWKCRCNCGTEKTVVGARLRSGNTISCGCNKREHPPINILPLGHSLRNATLSNYRLRARKMGLAWDLTEAHFDKLTQASCHYCGAPPKNTAYRNSLNGKFIYNGIDRKDNSKGYVVDNVVPCCGICNKMKLTMSADDFLAHVRRIALFTERKQAAEAQ